MSWSPTRRQPPSAPRKPSTNLLSCCLSGVRSLLLDGAVQRGSTSRKQVVLSRPKPPGGMSMTRLVMRSVLYGLSLFSMTRSARRTSAGSRCTSRNSTRQCSKTFTYSRIDVRRPLFFQEICLRCMASVTAVKSHTSRIRLRGLVAVSRPAARGLVVPVRDQDDGARLILVRIVVAGRGQAASIRSAIAQTACAQRSAAAQPSVSS
jgi:hypothetical protein